MGKTLEFLELDFHDPKQVLMAVSYGSVDYREIGKRKGTFSKTIKMPATKRNDAFFGYSFEVSSEGNFDPKIRVPIIIQEIDFTGTLQLNSVESINGSPISYSVNIYSDIADWVSLVGEGSIRDLRNLGSHLLTVDSIEASNLTNGLTGEYCYPLISYGGYLQELTSANPINVSKFRPAFYVLPLIRRIFSEAGYTFIDKGLVATPFRDAILPFTSKEVEFDDTIFDIELSSPPGTPVASERTIFATQYNDTTSTITYDSVIPFMVEDKDDSNLYNESSLKYLVPENGSYNIKLTIDVNVISLSNKTGSKEEVLGGYAVYIRKIFAGGGSFISKVSSSYDLPNTALGLSGRQVINVDTTISSNKNDSIQIVMVVGLTGKEPGNLFPNNSFFSMHNYGADFTIHPVNLELADGSVVSHTKLIQNVKKIDLLRDIMNQGNFRILTDNVSKTVEFIQVDKFLTNELEDWSLKVDNSRPTKIEHIESIGAKELEFSYSNDSDDLMIKDIGDRLNDEWARKRVEMDSEYRKGRQVVFQSVFSSTLDTNLSLVGLSTPVMSKKEPIAIGQLAAEDIGFDTNFENRILIYGGLQPGAWNFDGTVKTQYPYAYFSSFDFTLNWRTLSEVNTGTTIGLVDRYWSSTISRLNNSRLATFWMKLTELDIASLSFRKIKVVNGIHYYLNLVNNYKINTNQPTQVELISR